MKIDRALLICDACCNFTEKGMGGEMPADMNHYAWTTEETVVQIAGPGPFAITYVNPADDPSKQVTK